MSWEAYAQNIRARGADLGSIFGFDGNIYSSNDENAVEASPEEARKISDIIRNKDTTVQGTGVVVGGKKWTVVRFETDENLLILKEKTDDPAKRSMCFSISATVLVAAASKSDLVKAEKLRECVEAVRDYLKTAGC